MNPDDATFSEQVETLASLDPPLASRLMRLAGTGLSQREVSSIPQGVATIGARRLSETLTSLAVMRVFVPATVGQRNLWIHAIGTAVIARRLADWSVHSLIPPEHAYLLGLMHDLGRFVMYDRSPAELGTVDETRWATPDELIEAEMQICGYDHAFLGGLVAERWSFPDAVTVAIRDHHIYSSEHTGQWGPELEREVRLLQAADRVSVLLLTQPHVVNRTEREQVALLRKYCMPAAWRELPYDPVQLARELMPLDSLIKQRSALLRVNSSSE